MWNYKVFVLNCTATTEIYTRSQHDALPVWGGGSLVVYFFSPNSSANAANFGIARSSRSSGTQ